MHQAQIAHKSICQPSGLFCATTANLGHEFHMGRFGCVASGTLNAQIGISAESDGNEHEQPADDDHRISVGKDADCAVYEHGRRDI